MWKWLTGKKNKIIDEPLNNLDNNGLTNLISQSFSDHFVSKYDFDHSSFIVENLETLNTSSKSVQVLIDLGYISINDGLTDLGFIKQLSDLGLLLGLCETIDIITFKFSRSYGVLYENKFMFGFLLDNRHLYFPVRLNNISIFEHYKFEGYLDYLKNDKNAYNYHDYYLYDFNEKNLFYMVDLPVYSSFTGLELINKSKPFFPNKRTYLLQCKMLIEYQYIACDSTFLLSFNNKIHRSLDFKIYGVSDFKSAVDRMLFPFNLNTDVLSELGLADINVTQIDNYFQDEFEVKQMMEI